MTLRWHYDGNVQTFCYRTAAICLDLYIVQPTIPLPLPQTTQSLKTLLLLNIIGVQWSQAFRTTLSFASILIWLRKPCLVGVCLEWITPQHENSSGIPELDKKTPLLYIPAYIIMRRSVICACGTDDRSWECPRSGHLVIGQWAAWGGGCPAGLSRQRQVARRLAVRPGVKWSNLEQQAPDSIPATGHMLKMALKLTTWVPIDHTQSTSINAGFFTRTALLIKQASVGQAVHHIKSRFVIDLISVTL